MNISSIMNQISQTISESVQGNQQVMPSAVEESIRNGLEAIFSKGNGQYITGEVLQSEGGEILLSLGENQLLQAKLQGDVAPRTGQLMTFQIQNTSGSRITLTPLYENMNQNSNIASALKAAGLPMTDQTILMVKEMMSEGLPVDKQSLYQMNRAVNQYPEIPLTTLVQMQRLGIPLEADMIGQFQHYQNFEHQITNSLPELVDAFAKTYEQLMTEQGTGDAVSFVKDVLRQFTGEMQPEQILSEDRNEDGAVTGMQPQTPENILGKELTEALKQLGVPEEKLNGLSQSKDPAQTVFKELLTQLDTNAEAGKASPEFGEKLLKLFNGKEFQSLFKASLNKQLLLEPSEVGREGKVEQLYERLNEQIRQLNDSLSGAARQNTPLAKTVENLNQNLDFMNTINQNFTYVQIPLKMYNGNTNGELFVYTNKKSLAQKDGNVSALLHLDMEYLGSVDVHVTLSGGQNVATKFYLKDDAALDLIATHIDMLNERLNRRGYTMNAEFVNRDSRTNVLDEMLKESKNISVLSDTSFDVRA